MSTQTVNTTTTTRLAPFQEQFLKDIFTQAQNLKDVQQPFAPQQVAGFSGAQQAAMGLGMAGIGSYQPFIQAAQSYASPQGAAQFFNPFENQVVQQTLQDIGREGQIQQNKLAGNAVASGAFGGSRFGVAQAETARNTMEQQARAAGQLRQQGFSQAQQAAQQAAQLQGALGAQAQQLGQRDVQQLFGIGSLQQGMQQRLLDTARQNALAQQALPFQQLGFMSDIFRGVPTMQTTFQAQQGQAPKPDMLTTGIGLLGAGLSGGFFN